MFICMLPMYIRFMICTAQETRKRNGKYGYELQLHARKERKRRRVAMLKHSSGRSDSRALLLQILQKGKEEEDEEMEKRLKGKKRGDGAVQGAHRVRATVLPERVNHMTAFSSSCSTPLPLMYSTPRLYCDPVSPNSAAGSSQFFAFLFASSSSTSSRLQPLTRCVYNKRHQRIARISAKSRHVECPHHTDAHRLRAGWRGGNPATAAAEGKHGNIPTTT